MTAEQMDIYAIGLAEARKERGMRLAWDNSAKDWQDRVLAAVLHLAATRPGAFQICETRTMPGVGEPAKHQAWGTVSRLASAPSRRWIVSDGAEKSKLPTTNSSRLLAWRGTGKAMDDHDPQTCPWCGGAA